MKWRPNTDNIHAHQNKKGHLSSVHNQASKNRRNHMICGGVIVRILTGNYNDLTTVLRQPVEVFACPFALLIDDIADGK
jgi:hypothetical protein